MFQEVLLNFIVPVVEIKNYVLFNYYKTKIYVLFRVKSYQIYAS